jgi:propanol-preferring alcohol dehydrogenase
MELPPTMQAMVLEQAGQPLIYKTVPLPSIQSNEVLVKIIACGICRTDLHIADGELAYPKLPLILGHEIVGIIVKTGIAVETLKEGDVVGIPWLGKTCGECKYCRRGQENLCDNALFTGYTIDGGYAQYTAANAQFCFILPPTYSKPFAAPLLCAGLIGFRSYNMINTYAESIGIFGFGAAAHILVQIAAQQHKRIYAFTSKGDIQAQQLALDLGAVWAGDSTQTPPVVLDAAIIFAPVGSLLPKALLDSDKGAAIICGGIHMSDIPSFPYSILWGERMVKSVANLTRKDGLDFFKTIQEAPVKTTTQLFHLHEANDALNKLRKGEIHGAAVLVME